MVGSIEFWPLCRNMGSHSARSRSAAGCRGSHVGRWERRREVGCQVAQIVGPPAVAERHADLLRGWLPSDAALFEPAAIAYPVRAPRRAGPWCIGTIAASQRLLGDHLRRVLLHKRVPRRLWRAVTANFMEVVARIRLGSQSLYLFSMRQGLEQVVALASDVSPRLVAWHWRRSSHVGQVVTLESEVNVVREISCRLPRVRITGIWGNHGPHLVRAGLDDLALCAFLVV